MDTQLTDRRPSRPWLAAAGVALVVVCLVPPLSVLARRYLFAGSIQFCVFAMAAPALVALAARRLAKARRRRSSFGVALGRLITWVLICLFWRLPPVLDELARHPALVGLEAVALLTAGTGLWLDLVPSLPPKPRLGRPQRACVAALAMWSIWAIAYVLGFARGSVVHGYDGAGSHLLTVDDQEITAVLLWTAAAVSFLPVVFASVLTWLKDGSDPARERAGGVTVVRGWGTTGRDRRRGSAQVSGSAGQGRRGHAGG